jgi:Lon protease-like protein
MKPLNLACAIWLAGVLCVPSFASAQSAAPGTAALPSVIPLFPLPDVVLFPDVDLPLMIFEPRYRAMVADALKGDAIIGMVLLRPGYEADYDGRPPIVAIGTAGRITKSELLSDGRYLIELRGLVKFRVASEDQSRPYRLARVEAIPDVANGNDTAALSKLRLRLDSRLAGSIPPDSGILALPDDEFVNGLSQNLGLEPIERQGLLEMTGPLPRAQALIEWVEMRVGPLR